MNEQQLIERVLRIAPAETSGTLKTEACDVIAGALNCSADRAAAVLKDFENRGLIKIGVATPAVQGLDRRKKTPKTLLKWLALRQPIRHPPPKPT